MGGRFTSHGSYGQDCEYFASFGGWYRISWTVDFYYADSRLRYPRRFSRDTDEAGARRFCKRWEIPFPEAESGSRSRVSEDV